MRMFVYVSSNWSEKPTTSKSRERRARLERHERESRGAELGLHVDPRRVAALGERARVVVQDLVEDLEPEVAHPDVVDVGEREADAGRTTVLVLARHVPLAAEVPNGLFDAGRIASSAARYSNLVITEKPLAPIQFSIPKPLDRYAGETISSKSLAVVFPLLNRQPGAN